MSVESQESERSSCICVLAVDFVSFYDFPIEFWNCTDSKIIFVFFSLHKQDFTSQLCNFDSSVHM